MLCDGQFVVAGVVVFCCSCVVAILWNGFVAVALWRYCGVVVLQLRCGGIVVQLHCVAVHFGAVVLVCILHSGVLVVSMFCTMAFWPRLHFCAMVFTFVFLHNGIRVCVFAQWYSCLCFCTMVFYHNRAKNASILL